MCVCVCVCVSDNDRSLRVQRNDEFTVSCGFLKLVWDFFIIIGDWDQQVCRLTKLTSDVLCVFMCGAFFCTVRGKHIYTNEYTLAYTLISYLHHYSSCKQGKKIK